MASDKNERYIPLVTLGRDTISLQSLNEILKQVFSAIHFLSGRAGATELLDSLTVDGNLTIANTASSDPALSVSGIIDATPIAASWTKTSTTAGTGDYDWDTNLIPDTHFSLRNSNTEIVFGRAGLYIVQATLGIDTSGSGTATVTMTHGAVIVASASFTGPAATNLESISLRALINASVNDTLKCSLTVGSDMVGDVNRTTRLNVFKLN